MAKRDWSLAEVADGLEKHAAALLRRPGHIRLMGGGYACYPANPTLTRWQATDDSDFQADLLETDGLLAVGNGGVREARASTAGPRKGGMPHVPVGESRF